MINYLSHYIHYNLFRSHYTFLSFYQIFTGRYYFHNVIESIIK